MAFNPFSFFTRTKEVTPKNEGEVTPVKSAASRNYNANVINQLIDAESVLNRRMAELETITGAAYTTELDLSLLNNNLASKDYRHAENWRLANTPEISWCIDEIMSELLDTNIVINYGDTYNTIDAKTKQILENEFNRFIGLFNFHDEQFNDDLRHFIIDGEFAYESIVSQDHPEFGVIGIRRLRADTFDAVYSPIIDNGFVLNISVDQLFNQTGLDHYNMRSHVQNKLILNKETNQYETDDHHVALTFPDVTYICFDKDVINNRAISLIDKAREAYMQLAALQQAAIVMRITRSPERLLFNIDTGGMADKVANEHLRKFGNALSKKKTITPDGHMTNTYNPSTMLESWIFGKSAANTGTTVQSIASTANYDQLADVNYFHNRLLNIFKIPFSRITETTKQYVSASNLTYDEARFYKFIQSMQIKFSNAITKLFMRNLELRGIDIDTSDISIEFEPPERYTTYLNNEIIKNKFEIYEAFANREEFNKALLMQKYLGMSLTDIKAHLGTQPKPAEGGDSAGSASFTNGGGDFSGIDGDSGGGDFADDTGDSTAAGGEAPIGNEELPPDEGEEPPPDEEDEETT